MNDYNSVKGKKRIVFDKKAIHRNEMTNEMEPPGPVDEYLDDVFVNPKRAKF